MEESIASSLSQRRLALRLVSSFGAVALLLAAIGIYGVLSYAVTQRRREIGIRMALGASRARILREVLLQSLTSCGIGLAVGVPLSYLAGRLMAQKLFGVGSFDLPVVTCAVLMLALSAALAALLPARRAASIEPMHALRSE